MTFAQSSITQIIQRLLLSLSLIVLASCDSGGQASQGESNANIDSASQAATASSPDSASPIEEPANSKQDDDIGDVAALYQQSCFACHSTGAAGAPRKGDEEAWDGLLSAQGLDQLVENAVKGKGAMPPKGLCGQCSDAQIRALVVYMSSDND